MHKQWVCEVLLGLFLRLLGLFLRSIGTFFTWITFSEGYFYWDFFYVSAYFFIKWD